MPDGLVAKFWKAALAVGGLAAIGCFVVYGLYARWLKLPIFRQVSASQTFWLMLMFLVLVFLVGVIMAILWYLDRRDQRARPTGASSVSFTVPAGCTFGKAVVALAKEDKAAAELKGFEQRELDVELTEQELRTTTTADALRLLRNLTKSPIRKYEIHKQSGLYTLTAKGRRSS